MAMIRRLVLAGVVAGMSMSALADFYYGEKNIWVDDHFDVCVQHCPEIEYAFLDSGHGWLDAYINEQVLASLDMFGDTAAEASQFYKRAQMTDAEITLRLNELTRQMVAESIKAYADGLPPYVFRVQPVYHGHHKGLEMLSVDSYQYTGGAHGLALAAYYVFDMNQQRPLTLDDLIIEDQQQVLKDKLIGVYDHYLREHGIDPSEHHMYWDFFVAENFTFTRTGLAFIYQPYEIAPYVMGIPVLMLDYHQLQGIIKPKYLN